jgi:signal transduction histidine kinase
MKNLFLTIAFVIGASLLALATHAAAAERPKIPAAIGGALDLDRWQMGRDGPLRLAGQWGFYWGVLLSPDDFRMATRPERTGWFDMPAVWNGVVVDGRVLDGKGVATFRLRLHVAPRQGRLALLIPYAFTAYRLWIDDQPAVAVGRVGKNAADMRPSYRTQVVFIDSQDDGEVVLTLQISNFMHAKGGMRAPIQLVTAAHASGLKHRALVMDVLVFGCLMIMAIYHMVLFAFRRSDRFNLYFALLCFFFGLRAALTGEVFLVELFEHLDWQTTVRMEWLCVYIGGPLGIAFIRSLFPKECANRINQGSLAMGAILAIVTLLTPSTVFTGMFPFMTPLIVLMLGYTGWVMLKAVLKGRFGALAMLVSLLLVIAIVVNDILYANDLIQTGHYIPYGILFFVFSQALILARRSASTHRRLEATNVAHEQEIKERKRAEAEVNAYQDRLEDLVRERTDALAVANRRLQQELDDREAAEAEKSTLRERLQRAEKMEALGTLAGGVAHDLNNILSGVVGYPDLLLQDLPADSHLRKPMLTIRQSGRKAAAIVQDLLTLARRGVADFQVLDLNRIVTEYLDSPEFEKLIQFHPAVTVETRLARDSMHVKGSSVHLFKTVMNLVSNAAEAMPDGGAIRIQTVNRHVDRLTGNDGTHRGGAHVCLIVQDYGIGISNDDMERIFEPFYTKKVMGKSGTGLGMAVVWGTMKDHHGFIDTHSREGAGTTFSLYFPATQEAPSTAPARWCLGDHQGKGENLLVVDDVAEQRDIAMAMLAKLGYRAEAVCNGEAAVDFVAKQPVDLLLLDMIMDPGIDGLETYKRILKTRPGQRAVIASGYAETDRLQAACSVGCATYLKKPYELQALAEAVKAAMAG